MWRSVGISGTLVGVMRGHKKPRIIALAYGRTGLDAELKALIRYKSHRKL